MSLNMPSRRLLQSATSTLSPSTSSPNSARALLALQHQSILPVTQSRNASWFNPFSRKKKSVVDEAKMDKLAASLPELRGKLAKTQKAGRIQSDSIFSDEVAESEEPATGTDTPTTVQGIIRSKRVLDRALDPDPRSRVRWERKMVIRHVAKATNPFSLEKRADRIRRTEKEIRVRSPFLPTSWKKLVHLSRQIAGKTVDDALVQMRYSKKKMAKEIAYHLELAKDRAIVERGMGLGKVKAKTERAAAGGEEGREAKAQGEQVEVQEIQNKAGKWMKIEDPTKLYVAQSWINRGPWRGRRYVFRARGRCDMLLSPSTGISVILKEQKTLIREHKEREEKKYRQGPWVHLPDRPVSAQRQYYSW